MFGTSEPNPGLRIVSVDRAGQVHQLTSNARDKNPVWIANGLIAYTCGDNDANEQVFVIPADGGTPKQIGSSTRTVYGSRGDELLVRGADAMYWLDPQTAGERPGPPLPPGFLYDATTSPSGNWVAYRMGTTGQEVWRVRVVPPGEPERVASFPAGETVGSPAIRDDGHVLATVGRWYGDLVRVPARPGSKFWSAGGRRDALTSTGCGSAEGVAMSPP